ncbi:arginyl-tRNA--protein transferase 1-like isoform X3 [Prorops nasuta]|uniref:arginyl-tRNA--protein transferase 1-like isoform X3 n=1 Tax=Prorops nasuta TaxID=863751 RepID=UPI0034CE4353
MAQQCYSIVQYYAEHEKYKCGYCKSPDTNYSHGMWAHSLTVQDYQNLIDRGWRRSGSYCYKPTMDQTCCPMYTIKCEALKFQITKSQKKILKRMTNFLRNELKKDDMDTSSFQQDPMDFNGEEVKIYNKHFERAEKDASKINTNSIDRELSSTTILKTDKSSKSVLSASTSTELTRSVHSQGDSMRTDEKVVLPKKPGCRKRKFLRLERKRNKLLAQGKSTKEVETILKESKNPNTTKTLEELFEEVFQGEQKLKMKLVRLNSEEFYNTLNASVSLYTKYQLKIHGDPPEECDKKCFLDFFVKTPLQQWKPEGDLPEGYGSFHEQYWLDGKLIAVGVIDILPLCVSSVYFFYDPDYSYLSLGTFSSLRELYLTRQLNKIQNNLKYYYMGFYIHSCPKMRYKMRMRPSMLLCPETYFWCDAESSLKKLDKNKYSRLNDDPNAIDDDGVIDIDKILILYKDVAMPYRIYQSNIPWNELQEQKEEIKQYIQLVGMKCAKSMLLYRS